MESPDARHLVWVARNLLWRAHEALNKNPQDPRIAETLRNTLGDIDEISEPLAKHPPTPCDNTTMPPCREDAWNRFLEHLRT